MNEFILTGIILILIIYIAYIKESARSSFDIMVPRCMREAAQHAADTSRKQQVVVFDGSTFDILKADNQHAARGEIVFVASPGDVERSIKVGDCLRPKNLSIAHDA